MFLCYFPLAALIAFAPLGASILENEKEPDRLTVTVSPRVSPSGDNIRTVVRVDRHAANRLLRVVIDGPDYAGATERQLDGEEAARTFDMVWNRLPPGEYVLTVDVEGTGGRRHRATRNLTVTGGQPTDAFAAAAAGKP